MQSWRYSSPYSHRAGVIFIRGEESAGRVLGRRQSQAALSFGQRARKQRVKRTATPRPWSRLRELVLRTVWYMVCTGHDIPYDIPPAHGLLGYLIAGLGRHGSVARAFLDRRVHRVRYTIYTPPPPLVVLLPPQSSIMRLVAHTTSLPSK